MRFNVTVVDGEFDNTRHRSVSAKKLASESNYHTVALEFAPEALPQAKLVMCMMPKFFRSPIRERPFITSWSNPETCRQVVHRNWTGNWQGIKGTPAEAGTFTFAVSASCARVPTRPVKPE